MQVSNSTGQSTSYRVTGSGGGNVAPPDGSTPSGSGDECGKLGPLQEQEHCLADSSGRTVEFWVDDRLVASRWFETAPDLVSLREDSGMFWVEGPEVSVRK